MSNLYCANCGQQISATHKKCPHCREKIWALGDIKRDIEKSRLRLAMVIVFMLLAVGFCWFLRMTGGSKWPLYITLAIVAPCVPWLLSLAYKSAAPLNENNSSQDKDLKE